MVAHMWSALNWKNNDSTESKFCTSDVRVLEIPYFEVGNTSGKTAIIGGKKNG